MSATFKIKNRKKISEIEKLLKQKRLAEVIKECDLLLEKYPKKVAVYEIKYIALIQFQQFDEALKCLDKVIEINPNLNVYYQKASLLSAEHVQRFEESIELYDKIIRKNKRNSDFYLGKGIALACLKRYSEAEKCYDKAIKFNKHNSYWAYINKAVIKLKKSHYQEALSLCKVAFKKNRIAEDLDYLYFTKARIYARLNNKDQSIEYLKKAIAINGKWEEISYRCDELKSF